MITSSLRLSASVMMTGLSLLLANVAMALEPVRHPVASTNTVPDVKMTRGGVEGVLLLANGRQKPHMDIALLVRGRVAARTTTDDTGRFRFESLRGGVYQFRTAQATGAFRLWTEHAAPPSANPRLLIVDQTQIVRGVSARHRQQLLGAISHPGVLTSIASVAIATPLALDASSDDPLASP